ncbi:hypothetical protein GCM10010156_19330 [Planobispora rosea]|uniref:Secreted protein n=1 Tax=Planobispora rosea TaxID=35762 RepID=A0A8J3S5M6_PLARO|nr:hypothetical protein [Planobispora rosea]GGS60739.1 hypothetical protein GCM10010156_19330 [Planobispora rosea]GIH83968.1 hypothetical protein Pro02_23760 [Planobispora rosea]
MGLNAKLSTALVAGVLATGVAATTAHAAAPQTAPVAAEAAATAASLNLSGNCSAARGNYGNLKAYYYTRGRNDIFNRMNWYLGGPGLRDRNNVTLRLREHLNGRSDRTLWKWVSGDNVRKGTGGISLNEAVPRRAKVHADFTFVFDRRGNDPRCSGRTNSV